MKSAAAGIRLVQAAPNYRRPQTRSRDTDFRGDHLPPSGGQAPVPAMPRRASERHTAAQERRGAAEPSGGGGLSRLVASRAALLRASVQDWLHGRAGQRRQPVPPPTQIPCVHARARVFSSIPLLACCLPSRRTRTKSPFCCRVTLPGTLVWARTADYCTPWPASTAIMRPSRVHGCGAGAAWNRTVHRVLGRLRRYSMRGHGGAALHPRTGPWEQNVAQGCAPKL